MKKTIFVLAATSLLLSACNTIQGMGEDLTAAGEGVSKTAEKTKEKISK